MSHPNDPDEIEKSADALAWKVMRNFASRGGMPPWFGDEDDGATVAVHHQLSREVILPELKTEAERTAKRTSDDLFALRDLEALHSDGWHALHEAEEHIRVGSTTLGKALLATRR
jgi:hypothetical protein